MINGKRIAVVMPAYNAEKTLLKTYQEIPKGVVDEVILTDDASQDNTVKVAEELNITTLAHSKNMGYGANQKTCYQEAVRRNCDIVIMLHPDYQYTPKLITAMASMIAEGVFDVVIGSRILGNKAMAGGMPVYKYFSNRFLTGVENFIINQKLSEYHTGYRAFSREVLTTIPLLENSDDFVFDNEMLLQTLYFDFNVGEVSCPAKYFEEASSISFRRSVKYGLEVLKTATKYFLAKRGLKSFPIFDPNGRKLTTDL
ncbi:MAG: glycosyltransferase family 2 protein [Nitrospinae bacterium]|jgi:glycosyltransferase involved in cell wall biosynthesis|nr:glycosyltransferase family 2 protein [Nitrospinota bacterium]MDA1108221.1 glycosyltransferase family 2 protein [Nitrospinota bacterium]